MYPHFNSKSNRKIKGQKSHAKTLEAQRETRILSLRLQRLDVRIVSFVLSRHKTAISS